MDLWCAYLLFAQQQEAAQAPMQRRMQEMMEPPAARACPGIACAAAGRPPRSVVSAASDPSARQRAHLPPLDRRRR